MNLFAVTSFLVGSSVGHLLAESESRAIQRLFRLSSSLSPTTQFGAHVTSKSTSTEWLTSGGMRRRSELGDALTCTLGGISMALDPEFQKKLETCSIGGDRCANPDPAWLNAYCGADCSTWAGDKLQELDDNGCDITECDDAEAKDACGYCSDKCSRDSDCCGNERCAAGPNDIKICVDKEDDPKICDSTERTSELTIGMLKSNLFCSADDGGYCVAKGKPSRNPFEEETCESYTSVFTGCCGPTMFQYKKEIAPSRETFMKSAEENFSECLDTLDSVDGLCPGVDLTKLHSDAYQAGHFVAMSVALASAIASLNM